MKKITSVLTLLLLSISCFAQDTEAPTTPVNFQFVNNPLTAPDSVSVEWEHATDNVGVATYEVYINDILEEIITYNPSNTIESISFLNFPNGTFCLTILARDAAGNASPLSNQICKSVSVIYQNEPNKLFISGLLNHIGDDKAIELTNLTYQDIDLTDYSIKISYDGSGTWDTVYTFPANANILANEAYVIAHPSISICTTEVDDYNTSITNFDGNDVIGLFKYDIFYDAIGELGNAGTIIDPNMFMKRMNMSSLIPSTNFDSNQWETDGNNGMCPSLLGYALGIAILSTEEVEKNNFQIYPNPATGNILQFTTKNNQTINSVSILDINGRTVLNSSSVINNQLDIQSIKQGIYFVKIQSENKTSTHKLIRQ